MRTWARYAIAGVVGLAIGAGVAVQAVRSGTLGGEIVNGPWSTGRDIGTANASALTRAVVALRGLLALPASEARYFTARRDSTGRPLDGNCTYVVSGGPIEARWWSITLYDGAGWLIANRWNRHSLGSGALPVAADGNWRFTVSPTPVAGPWVPTATDGAFDLTLRTYRPRGAVAANPGSAHLPTITRQGCAA